MRKRSLNFRSLFLMDMNPIVRLLVVSDTVLAGATGLLGPIFALFVADFIVGGNEAVAGLAAGIFLLTKSVMQIPIAHLIDKIRGEKDDFWIMFIFTLAIGIIPILYLYITTPLQLYVIQFTLGLLTAFTFPTYMAIFTRHIDKSKEGLEWGIYFTLTDLTSALLAAVGGYLAVAEGFEFLIIVTVILSVIGALVLWPIRPYLNFRS